MQEWLFQFADQAPYIAIFGVLLLTGFGLPLPEDIPLIIAGYLAGTGAADPWIMFPGVFIMILGSDMIVYSLGRRYGHHVPRLPVLRRFLTDARLARTERKLHQHGGKFIFMARFLPGLRTASFFTSGTFKIPVWKFLLYDGSAAAISVPTILALAYVFSHQIDRVFQTVREAQMAAAAAILLVIGALLLVRWWLRRRRIAQVVARRPRFWSMRRRQQGARP